MKIFSTPQAFGAIVSTAALLGTSAMADQVILDDLIVDGSACIGFDCVNGESFGFDTLRLKENNLRIKAQDTSSTASFPSRDWQITFNDSSNGGQNKFSIDDIDGGRTPFTIEAGAPSHSLYVDDGGRLGLGTSTPVADVHVKSGNTPTLRLEQDGTSGFTPQTWDVAGNEANFFIRDATNGSTLPFRIRPGAPTSAFDMEASTGDIGFGTSSPTAPVHVSRTNGTASILVEETNGTATPRGLLVMRNNGGVFLQMADTDTGKTWNFQNQGSNALITSAGGGIEFSLDSSGNLTLEGNLVTGGGGTCDPGPCDAVFDPSVYTVPTNKDHASAMWKNMYLPTVGPTNPGEPINVTIKLTRMLNELEHAHIYIEQLHDRLAVLEQKIQDDQE